jgi:hypothetical protein
LTGFAPYGQEKPMARYSSLPLAMLALAGVAGCATVAHGTGQTVSVTSNPPGATVTLLSAPPGQTAVVRATPGVTPIDLELWRRHADLVVRIEKAGCPAQELRLKRSVSGWTALNLVVANPMSMQGMDNPGSGYAQQLLIGLPVMFGIDMLSGGAYKLPRRVHADLCER